MRHGNSGASYFCQTIWKVSRRPGKLSDQTKSIQTIRKVSKPSGMFPDHPESFQTIQKISRKFPDLCRNMCILALLLMVDLVATCKTFQNLSGWQCRHETWVFDSAYRGGRLSSLDVSFVLSKTWRSMFCQKHRQKIASFRIGKHCIVKTLHQ